MLRTPLPPFVTPSSVISTADPTRGIRGDAKTVADAAITNGAAALSSTAAGFTSADVGKTIVVTAAGASGAPLKTTIASVSGGVATLAATASTTVSAGVATYGTNNFTALQQAITDAETAGKQLYIATPSGGEGYLYDGALTASTLLGIHGSGVTELWGTVGDVESWAAPGTQPLLLGAVLIQAALNTDALTLTHQGRACDLADFGIKFAGQYRSTGHGISAVPPVRSGFSYYEHGIFSATWRNVKVAAHDGSHYAFNIINSLLCTHINLAAYGGGGFRIRNDSNAYNYGNLVSINPYSATIVSGTAHCYSLEANATYSTKFLNLMHFVRPQGWIWLLTTAKPGTSLVLNTQRPMYTDVANVQRVTIDSPDFENNLSGVSSIVPINDCVLTNTKQLGSLDGAVNAVPPTGSISSGTVYRNTRGAPCLMTYEWQLDPTGAAAATVIVTAGPTSALSSGTWSPTRCSAPISGPTGIVQSINFIIPSGYYFKIDWANATRTWTNAQLLT